MKVYDAAYGDDDPGDCNDNPPNLIYSEDRGFTVAYRTPRYPFCRHARLQCADCGQPVNVALVISWEPPHE